MTTAMTPGIKAFLELLAWVAGIGFPLFGALYWLMTRLFPTRPEFTELKTDVEVLKAQEPGPDPVSEGARRHKFKTMFDKHFDHRMREFLRRREHERQ